MKRLLPQRITLYQHEDDTYSIGLRNPTEDKVVKLDGELTENARRTNSTLKQSFKRIAYLLHTGQRSLEDSFFTNGQEPIPYEVWWDRYADGVDRKPKVIGRASRTPPTN